MSEAPALECPPLQDAVARRRQLVPVPPHRVQPLTVGETACAFCRRITAGDYDHTQSTPDAVVFAPPSPVTPGHVLAVSRAHTPDAQDPEAAARVMTLASRLAQELPACNIITSVGWAATQTVRHLHLHVVPRCEGDGLALPWTPGTGEQLSTSYQRAVDRGAPGGELTPILTALGGRELVTSHIGAGSRTGGLLLLEIAHAATEGTDYQGPRQFEFADPATVVALRNVALAFAERDQHTTTGSMISERLADLQRVVPVRALTSLIDAHRNVVATGGAP